MTKILAQNGVDIGKIFTPAQDYPTIADLFRRLVPVVMLAAGLVFFLLIIFGAFRMITSAGDPEKTGSGKKAVTAAIIGFIVIFAAYWIMQFIILMTGVKVLGIP